MNNNLDEDHLSHAAWGLFAIMHYESHCKHHEHMLKRDLYHASKISKEKEGKATNATASQEFKK